MISVVIVDDERIVVDGMVQIIPWEKHDMTVVGISYDGASAIDIIKKYKPELVITDIRMPGLNGFDMIRQAAAEIPNTKFIVVSAYNDFEYIRDAIHLGVYDYIEKPLTAEKLEEILSRFEKRSSVPSDISIHEDLNTQSVQAAKNYIDHNYAQEISLEQLANLCHVTPSYFSLLFKNQIGITYSKYINKVRMTQARELLKHRFTISEICEKTGFINQQYFNERFKLYWGCTPSEMRKKLQRK